MNLRSLIVPGLATLAMPAFAVDAVTTDTKRSSGSYFEDEMSSFMDFNSLEARIRLVDYLREKDPYVKEKNTAKEPKVKEGGTAAAVQLNFRSGWFADAVGFDASLYSVGNLNSPYDEDRDLFLTTYHLDSDNKTKHYRHTGYSKLGQAYVKAKLQLDDDEDPILTFKGGRERIYTGLIAGSSSRSLPSSWQGIDIGGGFAGLSYGFAWVDKVSLRNSSNFEELKSFKRKGSPNGVKIAADGTSSNTTTTKSDAEKIDSIWGLEVAYEIMGLKLSYMDAHAKDFLYSYNLNAGYTFDVTDDLNLGFNLMYYKAKEDGKLWTGYTWVPSFNKDANIKHFNITTSISGIELLLGYSKTEAKLVDDKNQKLLGKYYYDFGQNTYGGFMLPTSPLIGDFFYDGEKAWVLSASYKFDEFVPGLSAAASYTSGDGFKKKGVSLKEKETDFDIQYAFQGAALDGLSFRFRYGIYKPDGKLKDGTDFGRKTTERRIYLEYKSMVF